MEKIRLALGTGTVLLISATLSGLRMRILHVFLGLHGWWLPFARSNDLLIKPLDIDETSIAAGIQHSCAIHTQSYDDIGGKVVCWGDDHAGQIDAPPGRFIQVSAGRLHSCAIRIDETVECWGIGAPKQMPEGLYEQISSGDFHSCGILKDKTIKCWGAQEHSVAPPVGKFAQVTCGRTFSCAITVDGEAKCWGENSKGQSSPPLGVRFLQLSASPGDFVCGVTKDHAIMCWGDNQRKQCDAPQDESFSLVSTSRFAACAIKKDKHVVCWGMKSGVTSAPADVQFDELSLGWNHGCGIRYNDGAIQCWGDSSGNRLDVPHMLKH